MSTIFYSDREALINDENGQPGLSLALKYNRYETGDGKKRI